MLLNEYFILFVVALLLQIQCVLTRRYLGCYYDYGRRLLPRRWNLGFKMTVDNCMEQCSKEGYRFGGTRFSDYCFCGDRHPPNSKLTNWSICNSPCMGNKTEICGGIWHTNIYDLQENDAAEDLLPFAGCFETFSSSLQISTYIRASECVSGCRYNNFMYAGFRGATCECSHKALMKTNGTSPKDCGRSMAVYTARKGFAQKYMGCYKMERGKWSSELLVAPKFISCLEVCRRKGLRYAAHENISRCHCSSKRPSYEQSAHEENCRKVCGFKFCRDPGYALVFDLAVGHPFDTELKLEGCYKEERKSRILISGFEMVLEHNTPEKCTGVCHQRGYSFAGTKKGYLCRCGQELKQDLSPGSCSEPCVGDYSQTCGGKESIAVYRTQSTIETQKIPVSPMTVYPAPAAQGHDPTDVHEEAPHVPLSSLGIYPR